MQRFGAVIRLQPGAEEKYKYYHANPWPEINDMIRQCNIRNYSIFLKDGCLFGYYEYHGMDHKADMAKMDEFKGDKAKFLPKRTYKDKLTLGKGKDEVDLFYFGPGHTNGDTFVIFPALPTRSRFVCRTAIASASTNWISAASFADFAASTSIAGEAVVREVRSSAIWR